MFRLNHVSSGGADYNGREFPFSFPAGSTKESFSISIVDDVIFETDETFFLTLEIPQQAQDTGVMRGDPYVATVTIINDEGECSVTKFALTKHSSIAGTQRTH